MRISSSSTCVEDLVMSTRSEVRRMAGVTSPVREVVWSKRELGQRVAALVELGLAFEVHALWEETVLGDGDVWREPLLGAALV